jgi:hypothetical protein
MFTKTRSAVVVVLSAALLLTPALVAGSGPGTVGVTIQGGPDTSAMVPVGSVPAIRMGSPAQVVPQPKCVTNAIPEQQPGWVVANTLTAQVRIPAGSRYVVRVDHRSGRLEAAEVPPDNLTFLSYEAVARAPRSLQGELADNLGRLAMADQDRFAQLILDAQDPVVDEVAFQVARLPTVSLTNPKFTADLIAENARMIYEQDKTLQYVDVVDHGSAATGGDYYSTTRYRIAQPDDPTATSWVEIPKEMYYWYVVHPKLSDEVVKASSERDTTQSTYGYFWRNYLFYNPDSIYDYTKSGGTPGVYPVLADVLETPTVFWDGKAVDLPGGRPFEASDTALDVIGNWVTTLVPEKAQGNRPVQPNQIAYEHNGNCGELQDILGAASRIGLIPNILTSDYCEDHVWNEFYAAGPTAGWHPYQVDWARGPTRIDRDNVAYDKDRGGAKDVSGIWAWRPDGYVYDIVDRYSKYCTLVVDVKDSGGKPVDGAQATLYSETFDGSGFAPTTFDYTDATGTATFKLGDLQNYYLRVVSSLGNYPGPKNGMVKIIDNSQADQNYASSVTLAGKLPGYTYLPAIGEGNRYRLGVHFEATHDILYGKSLFGDQPDFAEWRTPGRVDFFVTDSASYASFRARGLFGAIAASEDATAGDLTVPLTNDRNESEAIIFANEDRAVDKEAVDITLTLYRNAATGPIYLPLLGRLAEY